MLLKEIKNHRINRTVNAYTGGKIKYKFDGNINKLDWKVFVKVLKNLNFKTDRRPKKKYKGNIRQSSFGKVCQQRGGNNFFFKNLKCVFM